MTVRYEYKNMPYSNWSPHERPEWLLFEIEMDLNIQRNQVTY